VADKDFQAVFDRLRNIMRSLEPELVLKHDKPGDYSLDTHFKRKDGYVIWFGGVQIKKNYVSYHLMPVYDDPELLKGVSDDLKKKMQGKSCFNFKALDETLFAELEELTRKGFERIEKDGYAR
jgi:hypothetical protein